MEVSQIKTNITIELEDKDELEKERDKAMQGTMVAQRYAPEHSYLLVNANPFNLQHGEGSFQKEPVAT